MTHLRKMMLEELERRNNSQATTRRYLRFVERFAQHFGKSPDKLGPDHIRTYLAYLLKASKLEPGTVENHVAALRFLFIHSTGLSFVLLHVLDQVPSWSITKSVSRARRFWPQSVVQPIEAGANKWESSSQGSKTSRDASNRPIESRWAA